MIRFFQDLISKYSPPGYLTLSIFGLQNYEKVIDLGCGNISVLKSFNNKYKLGVDLFQDYLDYSKKNNFHHTYLLADVTSSQVKDLLKNFDAVICFDVIEHLESKKAIDLIDSIEKENPKFIAFRTTSKFVIQDEYHGNPYQIHKSFTSPDYFRNKGYIVVGTDGPNFIMVRDRKVIQDLSFFHRLIANLLKPFFYFFPEKCLNYIAVKVNK